MDRINEGIWALAAVAYIGVMLYAVWRFYLSETTRRELIRKYKRVRFAERWASWPSWAREAYVVRFGDYDG
jgi:hypothetical protein